MTRRGQRSVLQEISRFPPWAKELFGNLRDSPIQIRRSVIRILRAIANIIESEWFQPEAAETTESAPSSHNEDGEADLETGAGRKRARQCPL